MRVALVADVHANLWAFEAVLAKLARQTYDQLLCLGDLIGYNARPNEVVALIRQAGAIVVAGNHDRDIARGVCSPGTSRVAAESHRWTHERLNHENRAYLEQLPGRIHGASYVAVHGCYLNPEHVFGYITSTMIEENMDAIQAQPGWGPVAFHGHTHLRSLAWREPAGLVECNLSPHDSSTGETVLKAVWPAKAGVVLINPGSVGQPRDGDTRASWAIVDFEARRVEFHRTPYDFLQAALEVEQAGLPHDLARRIREGR